MLAVVARENGVPVYVVAPTSTVDLGCATGAEIPIELRDPGLKAGDSVALSSSGASLGAPHIVTAAEVAAGVISFNVGKASLGADGLKNLSAAVTDVAGNGYDADPAPGHQRLRFRFSVHGRATT